MNCTNFPDNLIYVCVYIYIYIYINNQSNFSYCSSFHFRMRSDNVRTSPHIMVFTLSFDKEEIDDINKRQWDSCFKRIGNSV